MLRSYQLRRLHLAAGVQLRASEETMAALVLKKWQCSETPLDQEGTHVYVVARQAGIIAWLLALMGIDATTTLRVTTTHILLEQGSLAGHSFTCLPLSRLSSTRYGYEKPWLAAIIVGIAFLPVFGVGLILGPLYYFLNKSLTIAVTELGGIQHSISFKRSVIEGVKVEESQASEAISQIQRLANDHM